MKSIVLIAIFIVAILCGAWYMIVPFTEDVLFNSLDDPDIQSKIISSTMIDGDLVIKIQTIEAVKITSTDVKYNIVREDKITTVTIFNYTNQKFNIVVGDSSDVYLFGVDSKKEYNEGNKTVIISNDTSKTKLMTVKLISSVLDLTTFTEVFEVTNFELYSPDKDVDFKARSELHRGSAGVHKTEWFVEKNISYIVNVTEYKIIQVEEKIYNNKTGKNETVFVNKTVVAGYHNETHYKNTWAGYDLYDTQLSKNTVQKIRVVYHKKPELGIVQIKTVPVFMGVECDELTWWNTSWGNKREIQINNTGGSALTYYQVNMDLSGTPINSTSLRVVNETADATVPHWQEIISSGDCTNLWFNATSIPASAWLNGTYFIYYENAEVAGEWDGTTTFQSFFEGASDGWTEVDPTSRLAFTNNRIEFTTLSRNDQVYIYKDLGADAITSSVKLNWKASVTASGGAYNALYQMATIANEVGTWSTSGITEVDNGISCQYHYGSGGINIASIEAGSITVSGIVPINIGTTYYCSLQTSGTLTTLYVYSDEARTTQIASSPVSLTNAGTTYRYLYLIQSEYDNDASWGTGWQDNQYLAKHIATEPTATLGTEEDAFSIISYAPSTPLNKLESESQYFNVTTGVNCQCRWYINGSLKQTNTTQQADHNYTNTSLEVGYFNFSAVVNTSSGATDMQTWWVTVTNPPFIPPDPTNLTNTTGNFWIKHVWDVGAGNITNEYAVNVNGSWHNTSDAFINLSKSSHGYQNITVQAWNSSGVGTLSVGTLSDNVSLPNNPVTLTNYSLIYSIQEFDTISIDFDYTDADGDVVTFATDAVNGSLDSATGVYSWTTTMGCTNSNYWTFNVSDGYGSVDSVVIDIEVTQSISHDFVETFEYHPYANIEWVWADDAYNFNAEPWYKYSTSNSAVYSTLSRIEIIPYQNTYTNVSHLKSYLKATDVSVPSPIWAENYIQTAELLNTNYVALNVKGMYTHGGAADSPQAVVQVRLYNTDGFGPTTVTLSSNSMYPYGTSGFYEFQVLNNQLYLIANGTSQGIVSAWNGGNIGYVEIYTYVYCVNMFHLEWIHAEGWFDDITVNGNAVGIGADRSPNWYNTHYMTHSELDLPDQPDYEIDVSYTFNTLDSTSAQYQIKIQKVLSSLITNTTTIKNAGTAWSNNTPPFGTILYNRTDIFGDNYGLYLAYTTKDGTVVATDYVYWMNPTISGNSSIVVDLPTYPAGAQISPSYFIDNINLVEYKYYIKTLSLFGTQMDISSDLLVDTGTVDVDTTGYDVTSYWCILVRKSRADGSAVEMASDLFAITNTISAEGIVYNAESGSPLGDSKVALYQNGLWYNTTTNSTTGEYNLSDLTTDIDITVYAEHTGYTHESFTFTPLVAGIISLDIYMIPDTPSYTGTAIGGLALYAPYHQALNGATVNLWNSSWSDDTASSATGYYLFDNIVNGSFTGNATMPGYSAATNEDIVTASGDYTQQNYLLQPLNTLTVKAKDASTHATIMTFSVVFDKGVTYETTDGFINITTGIGIYKVEVSAEGYYVGIDYATVVSDTEITLYLVPIDESGEGIYYPSHYVSFIVQSITGTLYANVTTSVYNAASSNGTALFSDVTGSDGVVGFELNETTLYRITFVDAAQGIDEEFTLYPIDTEYVVIVSSSISFVTETPDTNLTNTTVEYTNQTWSIQNLTGDYLSTTLGISHTGQGVIAATICWATATIACGVPTLIVLGILAQLGVVSWIMVLFTGMTMLSIYILGGKIG